MKMNLYRVTYLFKPSKDGNPQEKVAFVVANTDRVAVDYVNALIPRILDPKSKALERGYEVQGANIQVHDVLVATAVKASTGNESIDGAADARQEEA
jgi:hypothetical protein